MPNDAVAKHWARRDWTTTLVPSADVRFSLALDCYRCKALTAIGGRGHALAGRLLPSDHKQCGELDWPSKC